VFPGDFDCRREQPHTKWHEESANAFADAMELTLFLDKFLRTGNDPATGGSIDPAPWQCVLDNKCLDIYGCSSSTLSPSLSLSSVSCLFVCLVCLPVWVLSYGSFTCLFMSLQLFKAAISTQWSLVWTPALVLQAVHHHLVVMTMAVTSGGLSVVWLPAALR
jgi:hypothetical protein